MEVDIFIPCFIDQVYPETGFNMVKILEKLGVGVHYNPNQTCCGQMAFNSGYWDNARDLGIKFIKDFSNKRPVVGPSASCIGYVRNNYGKLFYNSPWHLEYNKLKGNIYEITDFLVNVLKVEDVGAKFEARATYHDSCAALREYRLNDEPRKLLRKVKGLELIEMNEREVCCGFGGTFAVKYEAISSAMAEQKVRNALETGAEYIISTDSSCLMHQQGYIDKHNLQIKTKHIVDLLAEGIMS
ncbi:MAG: Fe-S oxidoreductase [Bacteroidetes bacterium 4484_276]|nr:MAG: Fe-S oxidoreductase [Bacteroidetes bacterium 4484_276]